MEKVDGGTGITVAGLSVQAPGFVIKDLEVEDPSTLRKAPVVTRAVYSPSSRFERAETPGEKLLRRRALLLKGSVMVFVFLAVLCLPVIAFYFVFVLGVSLLACFGLVMAFGLVVEL